MSHFMCREENDEPFAMLRLSNRLYSEAIMPDNSSGAKDVSSYNRFGRTIVGHLAWSDEGAHFVFVAERVKNSEIGAVGMTNDP